MHGEITQVHAYRSLPALLDEVAASGKPIVYPVFGRTPEQKTSSNKYERNYVFTIEVCVKPVSQIANASGLADVFTTTETVIDAMQDYYDTHRRMTTNASDTELAWLAPHLELTHECEGFRFFQPLVRFGSRNIYAGTIFQLSIPITTEI